MIILKQKLIVDTKKIKEYNHTATVNHHIIRKRQRRKEQRNYKAARKQLTKLQ